jgi:hypothetical protein
LNYEQVQYVQSNPDLQIASYVENGMMEYDLNNNETIKDYPNSTNPCYFEDFRKALAFMIYKPYIIADILTFMGSRIDVPVCYPQTWGWVNSSVVTFDFNQNGIIDPSEANYPYEYDPAEAVKLLVGMGFNDTNKNGYLNYPDDPVWGVYAGQDTTQMPLKIIIRKEDNARLYTGRYMVSQLEGDAAVAGDSVLALSSEWANHPGYKGGDFDTTDVKYEVFRAQSSPIVMTDRNYMVYTGGWSFGRYPTYLFFLFHSMFWYPKGSDYVTGEQGTHPILDDLTRDIYYAPSIPAAQVASLKATGYMVDHCVNIPLWSYTSYYTWRKEIAGIVNMKGYGVVNDYTFLNAYRCEGGKPTNKPLRFATISGWDVLNPFYSQWYFEYAFLDRLYPGLIAANPYDLAIDLPWIAQDWSIGTWFDARTNSTKTKVTYWLRKDAGFAAPVTGNFAGFFDSNDYEFSCWYTYAFDDGWNWGDYMDVNHIKKVNSSIVEVYFDDVSYWFYLAPTYPLVGPSALLLEQLCTPAVATFHGSDLATPPEALPGYYEYQFTADQVVRVINATRNDVPIEECKDFYIRAGYDVWCHNVFVNETNFAPGDVIKIWYEKPIATGAGGSFIGGNLGYDYPDTMYSLGTHYVVSVSGTAAALNKNPWFWMETPLLGEVDWRWEWQGTTKPRGGYYRIFITDVVMCTSSYCARGDGVCNPLYMPGADLDASDLCHVGILDLVTITGKYAYTYGIPPTKTYGVVGGSGTPPAGTGYSAISPTTIQFTDLEPPIDATSYEVLQAIGSSSASATFPGLIGATTWYTYENHGLTITVNTGTGVVSASVAAGNTWGWAVIKYHKPTSQWEKIYIQIG